MKYFFLVFCSFLVSVGFSQEISLKKGEVSNSLKISDSINETYSIYLPTSFTTQKKWPIVFVFDPEGRGRAATQLFRQAAEEQGYIIAASNNISKKDSLVTNLKVASRLFGKVFNFFPIDTNRIYTAGFGEGGQVAGALPAIYNDIQGVIAIAADQAWLNTYAIQKNGNFSFIGMAGNQDYHLYTMADIVKFLKKSGNPARLYVYNGGYEWPNADAISRALANFTLRSISKGISVKDTLLVENLYKTQLENAEVLRRKMEPYKSYEYLEKMKLDFAGFNKQDELNDYQKNLKRNTDFRKIRSKYGQAQITESDLQYEYQYFLANDIRTASFDNLGYWEGQMQELKKMEESDNPAKAEMAFRLQGLLASWAKNSYTELKEGHAAIDPLIFTSIVNTIFDKKNPEAYMHIISLSALDGDDETALLYLEDLLKTGYKNMEALYDIPGTLDLKLGPEYNSLVKKYIGHSKYYDISN